MSKQTELTTVDELSREALPSFIWNCGLDFSGQEYLYDALWALLVNSSDRTMTLNIFLRLLATQEVEDEKIDFEQACIPPKEASWTDPKNY